MRSISLIAIMLVGLMSTVPSNGAQMTSQIQRLLDQKEEKIKKLEECEGKKKGWMIAGISTIGVTAVGVGVNIAQASKKNRLSEEIDTTKTQLERQQERLEDLNTQISAIESARKPKPKVPEVRPEQSEVVRSGTPVIIGNPCGDSNKGTWQLAEEGDMDTTDCVQNADDTEKQKCKCVATSDGGAGAEPVVEPVDDQKKDLCFDVVDNNMGTLISGAELLCNGNGGGSEKQTGGRICLKADIPDNYTCRIGADGYASRFGSVADLRKHVAKPQKIFMCPTSQKPAAGLDWEKECATIASTTMDGGTIGGVTATSGQEMTVSAQSAPLETSVGNKASVKVGDKCGDSDGRWTISSGGNFACLDSSNNSHMCICASFTIKSVSAFCVNVVNYETKSPISNAELLCQSADGRESEKVYSDRSGVACLTREHTGDWYCRIGAEGCAPRFGGILELFDMSEKVSMCPSSSKSGNFSTTCESLLKLVQI